MKSEQLIRFLKVVECQSISKAAEKLFMDQSTLSLSITALEKELNLKLLERKRSGVTLTNAGKQLLPSIEQMVDGYANIMKLSDQHNKEIKSDLCIASNPLFMSTVIFRLLPEVYTIFPDIKITVNGLFAGEVPRSIRKKEADIGLCVDTLATLERVANDAQDNDYYFEKLSFQDDLVLWCRKDHPLAKKDKVDFYELSNVPFALVSGYLKPYSWLGKITDYSILNRITMFSTCESAKKAVIYGNMVTMMPKKLLEEETSLGYLNDVVVGIDVYNFETLQYGYLVYNKQIKDSSLGQLLLKEIYSILN